MKEHSKHLSKGDGAEGEEEHETKNIQHRSLSVDSDLWRLLIIWMKMIKNS